MKSVLLLTSGTGPEECVIAIEHIRNIMIREAQRAKLEVELTPIGKCKRPRSYIIEINGTSAERFSDAWLGSILWRAQSPVRPKHKRRNWFVGVIKIDEQSEKTILHERDVRFESFRAGGPGGQHQNTTDSAVRAIHMPTGLSVVVRSERSQHRNKAEALRKLKQLLYAEAMEKETQSRAQNHGRHQELERGNPKRVFEGERFREKGG